MRCGPAALARAIDRHLEAGWKNSNVKPADPTDDAANAWLVGVTCTFTDAQGRDTQLNIPARPIERFQLSLSQEELVRLRLGLFFIVPGLAALLGLLVYWTRRN